MPNAEALECNYEGRRSKPRRSDLCTRGDTGQTWFPPPTSACLRTYHTDPRMPGRVLTEYRRKEGGAATVCVPGAT